MTAKITVPESAKSVFLRTTDVAAILGISHSTCLRRIRSGDIPAVAEHGVWRVLASDMPSQAVATEPVEGDTSRTMLSRRLAELPPLLTAEQVANVTGCGLPAIRTAMRRGDIPTRKVGAKRMVPVVLLGEWLGLAG